MAKLNKENTKWLDDNKMAIEGCNSYKLQIDDVYEKLLEMQNKTEQLEQENAELKAHVEFLVDVVDEISTANNSNMLPKSALDLACNAIASVPQQSLAQHDKEVAVNAIEGAHRYVVSQFPNGFLHSMSEYLAQIKGQAV